MAPPTKLTMTDQQLVDMLTRQGMTQKQVADAYGTTKGAVHLRLLRIEDRTPQLVAALLKTRPRYDDMLPWRVSDAHRGSPVAARLRWAGHRRESIRKGLGPDDGLNKYEAAMLDTFLEQLREADLVVDYHPDAPPNAASPSGGFFLIPRDETVDGTFSLENLIRKPRRRRVPGKDRYVYDYGTWPPLQSV